MEYLNHEYLVPIIIGSGKNSTTVAKRIRKTTGAEVHLFADNFSLWQRMKYRCHKVAPFKADFLIMSLMAFEKSLEEYYFPVIILCGDDAEQIVNNKIAVIESSFVVVRYDEITK